MERKESRMAFFRDDYPYTDNENWLVLNMMKKGPDGKPVFHKEPVNLKYFRPKEARADYFKVVY